MNLKKERTFIQLQLQHKNGDLKTYTIVVNYNNVNAFLDDLKVINPLTEEAYPFTFNPNTFSYTVNVGKSDSEVLVTGRAQDQLYAAIIGLGRYQVNEYGTTATINVVASDNTTVLTYTIDIIREEKSIE